MSNSLIGAMRESNPFMHSIVLTVVTTFTMMILTPAAMAANQELLALEQSQRIQAIEDSADGLFSRTLQKIKEKSAKTSVKTIASEASDNEVNEILLLHEKLTNLKNNVIASLNASRETYVSKSFPTEILNRHDDFVTQFNERYEEYVQLLNAVKAGKDSTEKLQAMKKLNTSLSKRQFKRSHQKLDPQNLPVHVPNGKTRKPATTKDEFKNLGFGESKPIQLASSQLTSLMLAETSNAPTSEDLQFNQEVQINDDIRNLASFLDNNPVNILNWVRNNIDFVPTYGSIQGSAMTLDTRQGNAFDTASLLISLLRAANIHSRYSYGTVEVPIDKVMNWVGGVTTPEAALLLLGQGGIPNTGLAFGGQIVAVRMEHVWVEAWVDYHPSRGEKHKAGDSWIPMDGSFKQFVYSDGVDLESSHFQSTKTEMDRMLATVNVNQTGGYVQGVDLEIFRNMMVLGEKGLWDYLDEQPVADQSKSIQSVFHPVLATGLPYKLTSRGYTTPFLPESAKHTFTYKLFSSQQQQSLGSYDFEYHVHYSELAGKTLKLGFVPATETDKQTLQSYFSNIQPGVVITKDQLPDSIPGYLIYMKPVLTLDDEIVAQGSAVAVGHELVSSIQIRRLGGSPHLIVNTLVAGESQAIRLSLGNQPAPKEIINVVDRDPHRVLQNTSTSYFGHLYYAAEALNVLNKTISYQHPSVGTFSTELVPEYWFGLPRRVSFGGMQVDLDIVEHSVISRDNNIQDNKNAVSMLGMMASILEGEVPAIFGTSEEHPGESVSAMHALAVAMQTGMKIYTINNSNQQIINALAVSEGVKTDIRNAINSGREVIVPEGNVLIDDWVGVGYVINDQDTGAGIYRISEGLNGGKMPETDITAALTAVGLGVGLILNTVIPVANADVGSCEDDNDDSNNLVFSLFVLLVFVILLLFITRGGGAPVLVPAMVVLFINLNDALAAGNGCPIYVSGSISSRGGPMQEATAHVASAIVPRTRELTYIGRHDDGWYNYANVDSECKGNITSISGKSCDEYPFLATAEAGPAHWGSSGNGWVSLKLIDSLHNSVQGGTLSTFYRKCGLRTPGSKFRVETGGGVTQYLDNDRNPCGFNSVLN